MKITEQMMQNLTLPEHTRLPRNGSQYKDSFPVLHSLCQVGETNLDDDFVLGLIGVFMRFIEDHPKFRAESLGVEEAWRETIAEVESMRETATDKLYKEASLFCPILSRAITKDEFSTNNYRQGNAVGIVVLSSMAGLLPGNTPEEEEEAFDLFSTNDTPTPVPTYEAPTENTEGSTLLPAILQMIREDSISGITIEKIDKQLQATICLTGVTIAALTKLTPVLGDHQISVVGNMAVIIFTIA